MRSAGGGSLRRLLDEQVTYYRAVAAEYGDHALPFAGGAELVAALEAFRPTGSVLELACGPGTWTTQLIRHATDITAVDASPEMLAIASARVADERVRFVRADLFHWQPDRRYDAVFFGFWLSHVPPERFESFWSLVAACLKPGGRVCFVDDGYRIPDELIEGEQSSTIQRRLNDGTAYRIVKVPLRPAHLEQELRRLGWHVEVHPTSGPFFWGSGQRATAAPAIRLQWRAGQHLVTWTYGGDTIHKRYPVPPHSVTTWPDPPSVVVVEAQDEHHPRLDNAVVLEPDGSERLRLRPPRGPVEPGRAFGFYVVYPQTGGLVAVYSTSAGDCWGTPDLHTGELHDLSPWR